MKIRNIIILIILLCINESCNRQNNSGEKIFINFELSNEISITDIYKSIKLIPLEKNKESLIGGIGKIIAWKDKFYVFDNHQFIIFIFDNSGHFITKINRNGKGDDEYELVSDFEINPYTNTIELLSPLGIIYEFDLLGKFIKSYKMPIRGRAVHFLKDISKDVVAIYSRSEKKHIIIYNKEKKSILSQFFEVPQNIMRTTLQTSGDPFSRHNESVIFFQGFTNDVYELDEMGLKIKYSWDFGKYNTNVSKLPNNTDIHKFVNYITNLNSVIGYIHVFENSKYIFSNILKGKTIYSLKYDKSTKSYFIFDKFKENIKPHVIDALYGEGGIACINPYMLKEYICPEILDDRNKRLLENIEEDDNPVLVYYEF